MKNQNKLFAFKLAAKEEAGKEADVAARGSKWQAREGAPIAGCSEAKFDYRCTTWAPDSGPYC